ncbi:MAG: alpha/beta hydrolase-fold protein [Bacteroidales bacterium]
MKKQVLVVLFLSMMVLSGFTQVTFVINSLPDYTPPGDILYIAGDFQGWNPGDPNYALSKNAENKWFIQLEAKPEGTLIKFKFTRGDWGKVEKGEFGEEIPDRQFTYGNGETVGIIIYNWADNTGGNSTAADNVVIMDENFYMPQLNRTRKIWLYLPPDYESTTKNYPVIYMHDGQNLFDAYTSFAGEWEVDETLNELYDIGKSVPIVVGINNGGTERINEYTPWPNPQYGGGDGALYIDFIVETLKPYIDEHYRTLPERGFTAIWGSSLGGLISFYGALKFQDVFGKAGIFSPSYWFSDSIWTFTEEMGRQQPMRLYQMTGGAEGGSMVEDTWAMHELLTTLGFGLDELQSGIVIGGIHSENLWREAFQLAYLWLFPDYANAIDETKIIEDILLFPNPASDFLRIPQFVNNRIGIRISIFDYRGQLICNKVSENSIVEISELKPGLYIVRFIFNANTYCGRFIKQ